jgi:hypothetical protein
LDAIPTVDAILPLDATARWRNRLPIRLHVLAAEAGLLLASGMSSQSGSPGSPLAAAC